MLIYFNICAVFPYFSDIARWGWSLYVVYRGLTPPAIQSKPHSGFQKMTIFTFSADTCQGLLKKA